MFVHFLFLWLFFFLLFFPRKSHKSLKSGLFLDGLFAVGLVFRVVDWLHLKNVFLNNLVPHVELLFFFDFVDFDCGRLGVGCLGLSFI